MIIIIMIILIIIISHSNNHISSNDIKSHAHVGLSLQWLPGEGYLVLEVDPVPGQPSLRS